MGKKNKMGKTREIFNNKKLKIYLGKYLITSNGKRHNRYSENKVSKICENSEIEIYVEFIVKEMTPVYGHVILLINISI